MKSEAFFRRAGLAFALLLSVAVHAAVLRLVPLRPEGRGTGRSAYLVTFQAGAPGPKEPSSETAAEAEPVSGRAAAPHISKTAAETLHPERAPLESDPSLQAALRPIHRVGPRAFRVAPAPQEAESDRAERASNAFALGPSPDFHEPKPAGETAAGRNDAPERGAETGVSISVFSGADARAASADNPLGGGVKERDASMPGMTPAPVRAPGKAAAEYEASFNDELNRRIERKKTYPPGARSRGIQGTVLCVLDVGPSGELAGIRVSASSGSAILDGAAVDLLRRVFPIPNPTGKPITLEKAIRYSLVD